MCTGRAGGLGAPSGGLQECDDRVQLSAPHSGVDHQRGGDDGASSGEKGQAWGGTGSDLGPQIGLLMILNIFST